MRTKCYSIAVVVISIACLFGCAVKSAFDQQQFVVPKGSYLEQQIQRLDVEISELGMQSWPDYQAFKQLLDNRFVHGDYVLFDLYLWLHLSIERRGYRLRAGDYERLEDMVEAFLKVMVTIKKYQERPKFSETLSKFKSEKMPLEWRRNLITDVNNFFDNETK